MVRSLWLRALALTLVWTGVAWAQQPGPSASDKVEEQTLTIQEAGKSPQKCRIVKSFRTSDGHQAYQVRALDSGEMMTITEKSRSTSTYGAKPQTLATQIYHWGRMQVSPPGVPAPASESPAKNSYQVSGNTSQAYNSVAAEAGKSLAASPYRSTYKAPVANAGGTVTNAGGTAIAQPVPEKDWRQSWVKSEEKPLRIEEKPKVNYSLAELAPLRIDGKPAPKQMAAELAPVKVDPPGAKNAAKLPARLDEKSVTKTPVAATKGGLSVDDPLLNPDKYMPNVLDMTPRASVAKSDGSTIPTPAKVKSTAAADKTTDVPVLPHLPEAVKVPSSPTVPAPEKSMVVIALNKSKPAEAAPSSSTPAKQVVIPEMPALADKKPNPAPGTSNAAVTIPTLPAMPEPAVSAAPAAPPEKAKAIAAPANAIGHATAASQPLIPVMPLKPVAPLAAPALAAPPAVARGMSPTSESGAERPSFVVLDVKGAEVEGGIKLPGVPNAVVAFGQPATVTAPPPDMVRKKTLETHTVRVMISQLKESLYPSQRERAAEGLTSANWKVHPQVVEALCAAALDDPAPAVRGRCAESLAALNVRSETALGVIHKLQADKDETVRSKADEALKALEPLELLH